MMTAITSAMNGMNAESTYGANGDRVLERTMATAQATRTDITTDGAVGTRTDSTIVGADGIPTSQ